MASATAQRGLLVWPVWGLICYCCYCCLRLAAAAALRAQRALRSCWAWESVRHWAAKAAKAEKSPVGTAREYVSCCNKCFPTVCAYQRLVLMRGRVGARLAVVGGGWNGRTGIGPVDQGRRIERCVMMMMMMMGMCVRMGVAVMSTRRCQQRRVRRRRWRRAISRKMCSEMGAQHSGT